MSAPRPSRRPSRLVTGIVAAVAAAVPLVTVTATSAAAIVPKLPAGLPTAIEVMPPYQPQTFCDPVAKRGTRALADLLTSTYAATSIVSLTRPCASDTSEHYDGRAIDWGVDHRNAKQRAQGKAFLTWLFAADSHGNRYAMVRRLGVMYVIWNKRIWGAWSQRWEPYSCSGVTACHVDHMHLSLDWSGAMKKTSYWTGLVKAPMAPPLLTIRALHVAHTVHVSVRDGDPQPTYRLARGGRYRIAVAGTYRYDGGRRDRADGECSTTDRTHWHALAPEDKGAGTGLLDLWVAGHHRWRPAAGTGSCTPTHRYVRTITVHTSTPLVASIDDPQRWSGKGSLTVVVTRIG